MMAVQYSYTPLTPEAAAASLGVSYETFIRKMKQKIGKGVRDLTEGVLAFEEYADMAQHFADNYPKAAHVTAQIGRSTKRTGETDALPNGRTGGKSDDESDAHKSDAVKSDDTETDAVQIGRSVNRTVLKSDADKTDAIQTDGRGRTQHNAILLADLYKRIEDFELMLKNKELEAQKLLLSQKEAIEQNLKQKYDQQIASDKTDARRVAQMETDALSAEIGRLRQEISDARTQHRTELQNKSSDLKGNYDSLLENLKSENGQLKHNLDAERASGRAENIEQQITVRLEKSKIEWAKQERIKQAEERTKSDAVIFNLRHQVSQRDTDLKILQAEISRFKEVSKKFDFKIKSLWREELDTINITSNVLAIYGFTVIFGFVGIVSVFLMIMFFKNTIKNLKMAKREIAARFGMRIAIAIECIYGFFHYTTFYDILKNKTESLLFKDAYWVSVAMMVIVSGLSIAALMQSRKQTTDDVA